MSTNEFPTITGGEITLRTDLDTFTNVLYQLANTLYGQELEDRYAEYRNLIGRITQEQDYLEQLDYTVKEHLKSRNHEVLTRLKQAVIKNK